MKNLTLNFIAGLELFLATLSLDLFALLFGGYEFAKEWFPVCFMFGVMIFVLTIIVRPVETLDYQRR